MILDSIDNLERYVDLNDKFRAAFDFLRDTDLTALAEGKHQLLGDDLFYIVEKKQGKKKSDAALEVHRKYIDIQVCLKGIDEIGWSRLEDCKNPSTEYVDDIQFFSDKPQNWVAIGNGVVAIFFPEDGHAPLVSDEVLHKVVFKLKVEN